jgi:hypothetical protein
VYPRPGCIKLCILNKDLHAFFMSVFAALAVYVECQRTTSDLHIELLHLKLLHFTYFLCSSNLQAFHCSRRFSAHSICKIKNASVFRPLEARSVSGPRPPWPCPRCPQSCRRGGGGWRRRRRRVRTRRAGRCDRCRGS